MISGKKFHRPIRRAQKPLGPYPSAGRLSATALAAVAVLSGLLVGLGPTADAQSEPARCNGLVATATVTPGLPFVGTEERDVIVGTSGDDIISGLGGGDIICGFGGNDRISGGAGNDIILAGGGNDQLFGNLGRDQLRGGNGNDRMFGGKANDLLIGGRGDDRLFGGRGNDRLRAGLGDDRCSGGTGFDRHGGCEDIEALDVLRPNGFGPLKFGVDSVASAQLQLAIDFGPATSVTQDVACPAGSVTIAEWGDDFSLLFVDDALAGWFYGSLELDPPLTMANGVTIGSDADQVLRLAPGTTIRNDTLGPEFFNDAGAAGFGGFFAEDMVTSLHAGLTCFFR